MTQVEYELKLAKIAATLAQAQVGAKGTMDNDVWNAFQGMLARLRKQYPWDPKARVAKVTAV